MEYVTLCKAIEKDVTKLVRLIIKTLTDTPPKGIGKKYIADYIKGNAAQDLIENSINRIVVLRAQEHLIGFAVINSIETHLIDFILIDSDYQRKGYGTYLLEKLYEKPYEIRAIDFYAKDIATRSFIEKRNWEPRWKFKRHGEDAVRLTYIAPLGRIPSLDEIVLHLNYANEEKDYIRDLQ